MSERGHCPKCDTDLDGGSIWETGLKFALEGKHFKQKGVPASGEAAERLADDYAGAYGATRENGRWGRSIGIYCMKTDRTIFWRCPDCGHEWERK